MKVKRLSVSWGVLLCAGKRPSRIESRCPVRRRATPRSARRNDDTNAPRSNHIPTPMRQRYDACARPNAERWGSTQAMTRPNPTVELPAASKRCPRCCPPSLFLSASRFPRNRARPDGLGSCCLECKRAIDRQYWQRNAHRLGPVRAGQKRARRQAARRRALAYLLEHPCVDCGERDPVVLDFDHVKGDKVANVSVLVANGYDWKVIAAEVAKCVVRCANCHRRHEARKRRAAQRA
jgi:hypothetical protein